MNLFLKFTKLSSNIYLPLVILISLPLNAETIENLEPMLVTTPKDNEDDKNYLTDNASTATRINTDLLSTPYSVGVITQKTLNDSQAQRLEETASFMSGVQPSQVAGSGGFSTDLMIRGFSTNGNAYLNGVLDNQKFQVRDMALIERIEILKGQSSVLYGAGAPGGTVNYITKKPQSETAHKISLGLGNYDYYRLVSDSTGKVNNNSRLLYRMIVAGQLANDFRQNVSNNKATLAPSLTWHYSDTGSINTEFEYSYQNMPYRFDNVYAQNRIIYDKSYVDPRAKSDRQYWRFSSAWQQQLFNRWSAHISSNYFHVERHDLLVGFNDFFNSTKLNGLYSDIHDHYEQFTVRGELHNDFNLWNAHNTLIIGTEYNKNHDYRHRDRSVGAFTLNIFNPVFSDTIPKTKLNTLDLTNSEEGYYLINQIDINTHWHLSGGMRYSLLNSNTTNDYTTEKSALTYNAGVTFNPTSNSATYFNYSQSFQPNTDLNRNNQVLSPKRGELCELGFKSQWFNKRLLWTMAIYQLEQNHLSVPDPQYPNDYYVSTGIAHSRGFETDLIGQLNKNLQLIANYSFIDARYLQGNLKGKTFGSIPTHSGTLWVNYKLPVKNDWGELTLGGGLVFIDKRFGDSANSFTIPSYIRPDLTLSYKQKNIETHLKIENLFDERYVSNSLSSDNVIQGNRLLVRLLFSVRFI